jgi:ribosomal protein S18 acetylase RimI-like enzyme
MSLEGFAMTIAIRLAKATDVDAWMMLAREVEHLFGPMVAETSFHDALHQAISSKTAFCAIQADGGTPAVLAGGVVISKEFNQIVWLAVSRTYRGRGIGKALLEFAIGKLSRKENIFVQTFDASVPEGLAARRLYAGLGFTDFQRGGLNPAGVPTMIMHLARSTDDVGGRFGHHA